jgi:hypothetical protein
LGQVVVGEGVDLKGQAQVGVGDVEQVLAAREARVVDEDGGRADEGGDGGTDGADLRGGGEVAVEVVGCWAGWGGFLSVMLSS